MGAKEMSVIILMFFRRTFFGAKCVFLFVATVYCFVDQAGFFETTQGSVKRHAVDLFKMSFYILTGKRLVARLNKYFKNLPSGLRQSKIMRS